MFGRKKREDASREQSRDTRGRFAETQFSRADSVELESGFDEPQPPGPYFTGPGCDELRAAGAVAQDVMQRAERFEAVRLPENASALDGAIAEASVSSLWLGRPRGPLAGILGATS